MAFECLPTNHSSAAGEETQQLSSGARRPCRGQVVRTDLTSAVQLRRTTSTQREYQKSKMNVSIKNGGGHIL